MSNLEKEMRASRARLDRAERLIKEAAAERRREAEERRKAAAESDARMAKWREESEARRKEAEEERRKAEEKSAKWRAEMDAQSAKWRAESEADFREIRKHLGGYTQNAAEAQEAEFADALAEEKRIGDIVIDRVHPDLRGATFQYDAACANGKAVVVVEIKHRVLVADVKEFAEKQLPHFAVDFPGIAGKRKIFGAVGGGSITQKAKAEAEKRGLFVLGLHNRKLVVKSDKGVRAV